MHAQSSFMTPNVRGHRADGIADATGAMASEPPGGPRG